jgi:glycosyltransferase involved in cell wall biosynthesis
MKLLYIAHNHPTVRPGGAEQHALELHRAMAAMPGVESVLLTKGGPPVGQIDRVHEGTFIAPVGTRADEYFLYTDGYYFDYLNGTTTGKRLYTKHLRAFLLAMKPDVVHIQHTLFLGYDLIREVRNTLPHAPIVYTLHEYLPICSRDGQMIRTGTNELCDHASPSRCHECFPQVTAQAFFLRQRFIQAQLGLVDLFLAPSRFLMNKYVEWGIPADKIRFEDYGRADSRTPLEPAQTRARTRLAFFGQFSPYKGIQVLLEAMRLIELERSENVSGRGMSKRARTVNGQEKDGLPDSGLPRVTLKLHGANLDLQEGEFKRTFTQLVEETRDSVTLVGKYSQDQLPGLMREVDWVVVPSIWWENSPLVIQEAFMNGRPVICSNVGGMAEKVTDGVNGFHFRVGDPSSLASTVIKAVQSPAIWDEMRRGIPAIYRLDDQVAKLRALYGQLLAGRLARDEVGASIE